MDRSWASRCRLILAVALLILPGFSGAVRAEEIVNSIGMKLVRIEPGTFTMGLNQAPLPKATITQHVDAAWRAEMPPFASWPGTRPGLVGVHMRQSDLTQIDGRLDLKDANFDRGVDGAKWSGRWRGELIGPASGQVTFSGDADLLLRVTIDGQRVVDLRRGAGTRTGVVTLQKGTPATIVIEFGHYSGHCFMKLNWAWPGQEAVPVPADALVHIAADETMANLDRSLDPAHDNVYERLAGGDFDETPAHPVTIGRAFLIGATEVTIDQFRQFRPDYPGFGKDAPYVSGISWEDANAFCAWLTQKEGKPYRLPTEAEWEYACRAGTQTPYWSGDTPPKPDEANAWGLQNVHSGVAEWCADWWTPYSDGSQTDPIGPASGWMKVVRGGSLDTDMGTMHYYRRSANRAAAPPLLGPPPQEFWKGATADRDLALDAALGWPFHRTGAIPGRHAIGLRVVQAAPPAAGTASPPADLALMRNVRQVAWGGKQGPDMSKPYYRTRRMFPEVGDMRGIGWAIGIERGMGTKYHNSAIATLPNGDMLASYYNCGQDSAERDPDLSMVTLRLRRGSDAWDLPSPWPDVVDANDEAPILWNDNGRLWLFWGCPRMDEGYPFQYTTSDDNGANWSAVRFPCFTGRVGGFAAQPINTAFRRADGTIFVGVDGSGSRSELFASDDDGKTWYDTGGRTGGRHTTFVPLKDGGILGYGGKDSNIDGFMPISLSRDWGKTWEVSKGPMPPLGSGQRPSIIRLASGRLFYTADMQSRGVQPPGMPFRGPCAALSDDEGRTWHFKQLVGGNLKDADGRPLALQTVGYVTAHQSPDGVIHIVTSKPSYHLELNEAWVLRDGDDPTGGALDAVAIRPGTVENHKETYPDGKLRVQWSGGVGEDGRVLLDGRETWFYPDGKKEWETTWRAGHQTGRETRWSPDGRVLEQWEHHDDGTSDWTVFNNDGAVRATSRWQGSQLLSHKIGA